MYILGSGLAGLIIGAIEKDATIIETAPPKPHKALLRFRSPVIGDILGIPFKKVTVYKSINGYNNPSIKDIIEYSRKVSGTISERSICDLKDEERWIAPEDFYNQLQDMCGFRIAYGEIDEVVKDNEPIISTIPMPVLANHFGIEHDCKFDAKKIFVTTVKIPNCNFYATEYYSHLGFDVYRASITKDVLIVESMTEISSFELDKVIQLMGLPKVGLIPINTNYEQSSGKIVPIDDTWRKEFMFKMTMDYGIFSVGRLATWKNIVLDEMYEDYLKVKKMIHNSKYDHYLQTRGI